MKKPTLSIGTFLVLCVLVGAVGVPSAWRMGQSRHEAMVEELEKELRSVRADLWESIEDDADIHLARAGAFFGLPPASAKTSRLEARAEKIEDRLEELTGTRPNRPDEFKRNLFGSFSRNVQ